MFSFYFSAYFLFQTLQFLLVAWFFLGGMFCWWLAPGHRVP